MSTEAETSIRARVLMVGGSVLFTLLVAEFLLFPLLLPHTPLKLHVYLDDGVRPLAQSSKSALVPEDYVALVGDSYAQGRGDWLLSQDPNRNGPFHSAHVIHERTGRDVLSFGRGGTGSVRAAVEAVAKQRYLAASRRFHLGPPGALVFYFYEGNDLHDTLLELLYLYGVQDEAFAEAESGASGPPGFQAMLHMAFQDEPDYFRRALEHPELGDREAFRRRLEQRFVATHPLIRRLEDPPLFDGLHLARFLRATLAGEFGGSPPPASPDEDVFPLRRQRPSSLTPKNVLRVREREVPLTVELQGPAPDLDARETDAALWALEESLAWLTEAFPGVPLCLVYIPSPAVSYRFAREPVEVQPLGSRPSAYASETLLARSEALRGRVAGIARRGGYAFVDPTPAVRRNTQRELLHGPTDVRHFNRLGYTLLGNQVSGCIAAGG
jgi:hypothetical protein